MKAIVYNITTGEILKIVDMPEEFIPYQLNDNEAFLEINEHVLDTTHYVLNGSVIPRPIQETKLSKTTLTADGIDIITITNAPDGTFTAVNVITKDTITGTINGLDTFSTTIVGTYNITVTAWPYLDFETTIEAV